MECNECEFDGCLDGVDYDDSPCRECHEKAISEGIWQRPMWLMAKLKEQSPIDYDHYERMRAATPQLPYWKILRFITELMQLDSEEFILISRRFRKVPVKEVIAELGWTKSRSTLYKRTDAIFERFPALEGLIRPSRKGVEDVKHE